MCIDKIAICSKIYKERSAGLVRLCMVFYSCVPALHGILPGILVRIMQKTVVLALDDILNKYSKKLNAFHMGRYHKNDPILRNFLYDMDNGDLTDAGRQIMQLAEPDTEGLQLTEWLSQKGFTVFICTDRDLRFAFKETEAWLKAQKVCYDGLFSADDPIEFCKKVGAQYFLFGMPDCEPERLKLFCFSAAEGNESDFTDQAVDLSDFGGVKRWIEKSGC